jgi:dUTP pyrophosphatase
MSNKQEATFHGRGDDLEPAVPGPIEYGLLNAEQAIDFLAGRAPTEVGRRMTDEELDALPQPEHLTSDERYAEQETVGDWAGHTPTIGEVGIEQAGWSKTPTIDAEIAAGQKQLDEDAIIGELEGFVLELDIPVKGTNVPEYATEGDAGADLRCKEGFILWPFERQLVGTGVSVAIPEGFVGYIKPRSGLAHKHGIQILGGVIDSGYRGEIKVIMHNTAAQGQVTFAKGDRIAQLVIQSVVRANFIPVETLPEAVRGEGGFGSTGHN